MTAATRPIAVYYEHPDWFRPLFAQQWIADTQLEQRVSIRQYELTPIPRADLEAMLRVA